MLSLKQMKKVTERHLAANIREEITEVWVKEESREKWIILSNSL